MNQMSRGVNMCCEALKAHRFCQDVNTDSFGSAKEEVGE